MLKQSAISLGIAATLLASPSSAQTYTWDEVLGASSAIAEKWSRVCLVNSGRRQAQIAAARSANIPDNMRVRIPPEGASFCALEGLSESKRSPRRIMKRIRKFNPNVAFENEVRANDRLSADVTINGKVHFIDICVTKNENGRGKFLVEIANERRDECPSS